MDRQIGLEEGIEEWVAVMVEVFGLVRHVLDDDGTLWINIGFSYDGRGNLVDQPGALKEALVKDGWYCKSPIVWHKLNPMPSSQNKRPTLAHEMVWLMAKDKGTKYFYDAEAIREPHSDTSWASEMRKAGKKESQGPKAFHNSQTDNQAFLRGNPRPDGGRNRRTVWSIATEAYREAHFATFPRKLVETCILAGTSTYGHCPECGARWVRVVEREYALPESRGALPDINRERYGASDSIGVGYRPDQVLNKRITTTGWRPTCNHDLEPVPDVVLDPFFGSGTVGLVAEQLGRRYIGIELSDAYSRLAREDTKQEVMRL